MTDEEFEARLSISSIIRASIDRNLAAWLDDLEKVEEQVDDGSRAPAFENDFAIGVRHRKLENRVRLRYTVHNLLHASDIVVPYKSSLICHRCPGYRQGTA